MWKTIVEGDRPQMIIWRMRIARWIPKATNTPLECVIFIAFPQQQWLHESISIACIVLIYSKKKKKVWLMKS